MVPKFASWFLRTFCTFFLWVEQTDLLRKSEKELLRVARAPMAEHPIPSLGSLLHHSSGETSQSPTPRQRIIGNWWLLGEGELASPKDEPSYWLFNTKGSTLKPYTHKLQKLTQEIVFIYVCIYVYAFIVSNNNNQRKRGCHFSMWWQMRGWGKKGKVGSDIFLS